MDGQLGDSSNNDSKSQLENSVGSSARDAPTVEASTPPIDSPVVGGTNNKSSSVEVEKGGTSKPNTTDNTEVPTSDSRTTDQAEPAGTAQPSDKITSSDTRGRGGGRGGRGGGRGRGRDGADDAAGRGRGGRGRGERGGRGRGDGKGRGGAKAADSDDKPPQLPEIQTTSEEIDWAKA